MKLNGNLVLNGDATGEIQNVFIERVSSDPVGTPSGHKGRIIFNSTDNVYKYFNGTVWVALATGGNAAAIQSEIDAIEAAIGAGVNSDGTFNATAFAGFSNVTAPTSLTNVLSQLDSAVAGKDALSELTDVQLSGTSNGNFLQYNGSKWVNHVLVAADLTDVTATAAELNILDGATLTTTELNYVDGVTSPIQTQLDGKQPLDAGLTALASGGSGIVVQDGDTAYWRTLTAPTVGITVTNGNGVGGNPTLGLANGLASIEALATTGFVVQSTPDTFITRDIVTASTGRVTVSNGDGVAGSPTIDLALVTDSGTGDFKKISTDAYGRVTGTTNVTTADITALVDATYVNVAGDTMTGDLSMGGNKITGLGAPATGTDAVNRNYVDTYVSGLSWKQAVRAASTANVNIASAPAAIDGVTLAANDRVLLKNQTTASQNGIYVFAAAGSALTRSVDMDAAAEFDSATVFVREGTSLADTGWTQTAEVAAVGTDTVTFVQFTGAGSYIAGTGLALVGNTFNVNLGAGIIELPSDEVGIDLFDNSTGAIVLTDDGTTRASFPASNSKLHLLLSGAGGLDQGAAGLFIKAAGVTNAMLANSTITLDADDTGTASVALGGTLKIYGDVTAGVSTSISAGGYVVTVGQATATQLGVAKFAAADFDVTAGLVTIKAGGVDNAQLAFDSITFTGTTGTTDVALGNAVDIVGDATGVVSTDATGGVVEISVRDATASLKGVASFNATDFTVTAGAVSANAKSLNWLTDVSITSPANGNTLVYVDGEFENRSIYFLYEASTSSTTHTVNHGLGQKYCNVTVVESVSDEVVIPESITFNNDNQLTVTFNSALDCKVIVMGVYLPAGV